MSDGIIIAICGESGAGKSTTTQILKDSGFAAYSLSAFLRAEAEAAYDTPPRERVQAHAQQMQQAHGNAYYATLLAGRTALLDETRAVVDGMRNLDELAYLRDAAAARGRKVVLLALVLDPEARFERVRGRARAGDPDAFEVFKRDDARANAGPGGFQDNAALIAGADMRIENTGDAADLRRAIADAVRAMQDAGPGEVSA